MVPAGPPGGDTDCVDRDGERDARGQGHDGAIEGAVGTAPGESHDLVSQGRIYLKKKKNLLIFDPYII